MGTGKACRGWALFLFVLASIPCTSHARESAVFLSSDLNPFIQVHALPMAVSADAPPVGRWSTAWTLDLANNSFDDAEGSDSIVLDGETYRLGLSLRHGVRDGIDVGVDIPLVSHNGGFMDQAIFEWHELFGLSNTDRAFRHDQLRFAHARDGEQRVAVERATTGIGDVRLSAGWRLYGGGEGAGRVVSLRTGLKLPTGDDRALRGSGSTDLSLQLVASDRALLARWDTRLFWTAGMLWLGDGGPMGDLRRQWVPLGNLAVTRPVMGGRVSLKAQLDAHGSFYDSELRSLGSAAVQLVLGIGIDVGGAGVLDLGFIEDLFTDTTPDFGLHFAWRALL